MTTAGDGSPTVVLFFGFGNVSAAPDATAAFIAEIDVPAAEAVEP